MWTTARSLLASPCIINPGKNNLKLNFIALGKPTQNTFIESFNGKFLNECLNENWSTTLHEARRLIELWQRE